MISEEGVQQLRSFVRIVLHVLGAFATVELLIMRIFIPV